ncbi:3-hydroxyacyl-CoA dehydrogenase NAD-binding domain-containing protein [Pseudarthrobacter sp. alpha12b]
MSYEIDGDVGLLTIDNPPVNASTAEVRAGLLAGMQRAATDPAVRAVVLIGAGRNFISGSDLKEFFGPLPAPELPEVIAAVEDCPKPVVAALSGATLGGGFELALGCDGRIALEGAVVGMPEITLGMIPGAGGTQRTMRLVGPARTIQLITSGDRIPVTAAVQEGLVDKVVPSSLREQAIRFAATLERKRILRLLPVPDERAGALEDAARLAVARSGPRPQVIAAIGAVIAGTAIRPAEAHVHERAEFNRLRNGTESGALRHLFFARKTAEKANRPHTSIRLRSIGVVGAGTMGRGIARAFVEAGVPVVLVDQDSAAAGTAVKRISDEYRRLTEQDKLAHADADRRIRLLSASGSLSDVAEADLVIEAVFEDAMVKKAVLRDLESIVRSHVPLATNTSYLDVNELASAVGSPGRVLGMHFFSPAHRTPVLEVIRGDRTSSETLDVALAAARLVNKLPLIAGVCDGFIGNRIFSAYRRQCELMLEEGALPDQVDKALESFGFAMGPFAVGDMSGLDVAWRMRQSKAEFRDKRERYPDVADKLCELGRFGQKTGKGWYRYDGGARTPIPDGDVEALILRSSAAKHIQRRPFAAQEIIRRCLVAMANEAALLMSEGIAERPSDIDLMLTLGYGFPKHEGGITYWAARQDPVKLSHELEQLQAVSGPGFRKGDVGILGRAVRGE